MLSGHKHIELTCVLSFGGLSLNLGTATIMLSDGGHKQYYSPVGKNELRVLSRSYMLVCLC